MRTGIRRYKRPIFPSSNPAIKEVLKAHCLCDTTPEEVRTGSQIRDEINRLCYYPDWELEVVFKP